MDVVLARACQIVTAKIVVPAGARIDELRRITAVFAAAFVTRPAEHAGRQSLRTPPAAASRTRPMLSESAGET